jgi:hypothetical protein
MYKELSIGLPSVSSYKRKIIALNVKLQDELK